MTQNSVDQLLMTVLWQESDPYVNMLQVTRVKYDLLGMLRIGIDKPVLTW